MTSNVQDKTKCAIVYTYGGTERERATGRVYWDETERCYVYRRKVDYYQIFRARGFFGYGIEKRVLKWLVENNIKVIHIERLPPCCSCIKRATTAQFVSSGHKFVQKGVEYIALIVTAFTNIGEPKPVPSCNRRLWFECSAVYGTVSYEGVITNHDNMEPETEATIAETTSTETVETVAVPATDEVAVEVEVDAEPTA